MPAGSDRPALSPEVVTFLETGCALIVGTVSTDGSPHAGRAWGLTVLDRAEHRIRLLLDASDTRTLHHAGGGGGIAITGSDVPTLRSVQLKGRAESFEPATEADRSRAAAYCDDFYSDIVASDRYERALLESWTPLEFVACIAVVPDLFDQTPGPRAGEAYERGRQ
jgi:hypothetical protein